MTGRFNYRALAGQRLERIRDLENTQAIIAGKLGCRNEPPAIQQAIDNQQQQLLLLYTQKRELAELVAEMRHKQQGH